MHIKTHRSMEGTYDVCIRGGPLRPLHRDPQWSIVLKGLINYEVEMGSVAMIYISSFIKIGSAILKLKMGLHRHTAQVVKKR
jgi:hypothetical protein